MQQFEITEDEELSDAEKDWKLRLVTKEFDHDKYWNKKMVDLYDNIMKIE